MREIPLWASVAGALLYWVNFWRDEFTGLARFLGRCLRCYRDWVWTLLFWRCAVTIANRVAAGPVYNLAGGVLRARVIYRFAGQLTVKLDQGGVAADYVSIPFERGVTWVPGWYGREVDALRAAVGLI